MKRSHITISLVVSFVLLAVSGCAILAPTEDVVPTSHPGYLYFEDDFSTTPNGWGTVGQEGGQAYVNYGGMIIRVDTPNSLFWTINKGLYTDTKIDVDAVLLNGPANDNFGVICRFVDSQNFYGFLVTHDGYYGIFKMLNGEMILSGEAKNLDFSEVIRQGGVVNHISATCKGDILTLSVNDVVLSEIQDGSFTSGQFGLIAGAYDIPGVEVLFDNFLVTQP